MFVVVAVAFKLGAVPFHMWLPDVYHGAPTASCTLFATVPKIASFAHGVPLAVGGPGAAGDGVGPACSRLLAVLSLVVGNLVALAQTNLKRMLAYSAIANVGFMLLGFVTGTAAWVTAPRCTTRWSMC